MSAEAGLSPPRAATHLLGHEAAEAVLARAVESGRLHHAWLISGPAGIGKATLAFRFARYLLAGTAPSLLGGPADLSVPAEHPVFHRIAAGAHLDLLTVERQMDEKRDRLRGEITVDDARRIAPFLRMTAAEGGWRIVIVDGAEAMNRNAANAILKVLEEPPERAVLLLVSHNPARLLPTIRSRCRALPLAPLADEVLIRLLRQHDSSLDAATLAALARMADGSVGRAIGLVEAGGLELYRDLLDVVRRLPTLDMPQVHALAERLSRPTEEPAYRTMIDLLGWLLARLVRGLAVGQWPVEVVTGEAVALQALGRVHGPAAWLDIADAQHRLFDQTDAVYLDRRQAVLNAFLAMAG